MKRMAIIGAVALGLSAGVTAILVSAEVPPFDPDTTKVRQYIDDDGAPVTSYEPAFPDPATVPTPASYGDFLLVPWGTIPHDVPNNPARSPVGPRRQTSDKTQFEADPLYAPAAKFPTAWESVSEEASAVFDDVGVIEVTQTYGYTNAEGESRGITISRMRPALPWRIAQPSSGSALIMEKGYVGTVPAIFLKPRIAEEEEGSYDIYWFDGEILSQLHGGGVFKDLLALAESMRSGDASIRTKELRPGETYRPASREAKVPVGCFGLGGSECPSTLRTHPHGGSSHTRSIYPVWDAAERRGTHLCRTVAVS